MTNSTDTKNTATCSGNECLSYADKERIAGVLCTLAEQGALHRMKETRVKLTRELLALNAQAAGGFCVDVTSPELATVFASPQ